MARPGAARRTASGFREIGLQYDPAAQNEPSATTFAINARRKFSCIGLCQLTMTGGNSVLTKPAASATSSARASPQWPKNASQSFANLANAYLRIRYQTPPDA